MQTKRGKINMSKIICKPCFAFDALAAIVLREADLNGFRNDIPYIKEQIEKNFEGLNIPGSDSYFGLLTNRFKFEKIEKMDLKVFTEVYTDCIKGNELEEQLLKGLQILKDMDFTYLWEEYCMPFLKRQCDEYKSVLETENKMVAGVLSDIQYIKPNERIDDINIYMTYFTQCVSFVVGKNSYVTNHNGNDEINIKGVLRLFTHELTHGISNEKTRKIYVEACEKDEFLKKNKYILVNKKACTSNEEEFVVALDNYISIKNGLISKKEAYNNIFNHYESCMPIAVIVFDELIKLGKLPKDVNSWIYNLFIDVVKTGEIENKVNSIMPGYVDNFLNIWCKNLK
jgi:hypothetical protein